VGIYTGYIEQYVAWGLDNNDSYCAFNSSLILEVGRSMSSKTSEGDG
jgi:hypothetical protein